MTFKEFLLALINPNDNRVSSKTVVGLLATLIIVAYAVVDLASDARVNYEIFYGILGLIATCFGLNTVVTNKKLSALQSPDINVEQADKVTVNKEQQSPEVAKALTGSGDPAHELEPNEVIG